METGSEKNRFLMLNPENSDLNQYWYSVPTIQVLAEEIDAHGGGVAFLSTPSLYFSVSAQTRGSSKVFDFDRKWEKDPGFVFYDYLHPEAIPSHLHHQFSLVVIDPPFITREVWEKYAEAARLLLQREPVAPAAAPAEEACDGSQPPASSCNSSASHTSKILASTIPENAAMLSELLGLREQRFQPSIPHLVYQYSMFANYHSERLQRRNPEIPYDDDDDKA